MAKGVRIVDEYQTVQDVVELVIAYAGEAKTVSTGFVASGGVIRQFWPSETIQQSSLVAAASTEETYDVDTTEATAFAQYEARTGRMVLSSKSIPLFNPPARAQGLYLWKLDVVSGNIVGATGSEAIGTWEDVNSDGTLGVKRYILVRSTTGVETGEATVTVAEDDGTGNPVDGSEVAITVNFTAEVVTESVTMTTQPWTLSNTEVNALAEVFIVSVPEGWWDEVNQYTVVESFVTGEYGFPKGIQISEIFSADWSPDVTIQVDEVSGTILGDATGTALSTATKRVWYIAADTVEVVNAVADITITDGVDSVTKRVTMRAEQQGENTDPGSGVDTGFTRYDQLRDYEIAPSTSAPSARMTVTMKPDGYFYANGARTGTPTGFPQMWQSQAPAPSDPQNYECQMTKVSGDDMDSGTVDTWLNCASDHAWYMRAFTSSNPLPVVVQSVGEYQLDVREVGRPETVKTKRFRIEAYVEGT